MEKEFLGKFVDSVKEIKYVLGQSQLEAIGEEVVDYWEGTRKGCHLL